MCTLAPADTPHWLSGVTMMDHNLRRWQDNCESYVPEEVLWWLGAVVWHQGDLYTCLYGDKPSDLLVATAE